MAEHCEVAIIGAGPYGLSAAAHLRAAGVETRSFGAPMEFWSTHMPGDAASFILGCESFVRSEWTAAPGGLSDRD
jgi:cation diffusion facilitator CzcD-associated flavoprotein CzcO